MANTVVFSGEKSVNAQHRKQATQCIKNIPLGGHSKSDGVRLELISLNRAMG